MPLTAESPVWLHVLQNTSLLTIAVFFFPLSSALLLISLVRNSYNHFKEQSHHSKRQLLPPACLSQKTILVTGVGMSKGLFIARSFYQSGHIVIGADVEPHSIPVCGRFSKSLKKFYRLPSATSGKDAYILKLLEIIKAERVDLWISCSGVVSAVEDGEAADDVRKYTKCLAVQFGADMTRMLHEKNSFIENTKKLGLNVPETLLVTSVEKALEVLSSRTKGQKYILKSVGVDDSIRADMTLLPFSSPASTREHLSKLRPSSSRPFVLQQFIRGPEYCTHAIIIRGRVAGFTACKSAELLMHYEPLPPEHAIFKALLKYTTSYVKQMGQEMTGHFSIDFLVDESNSGKELGRRIFPIECNPRAHTAVVNFGRDKKDMTDAYLSIFSASPTEDVFVSTSTAKHYWAGHDIVTRLFLSTLAFATGKIGILCLFGQWKEFLEHVTYWGDPTYEISDPWPAWWLYCVYWPGMFLVALIKAQWWSRCNVSTGKIFGC